MTPTTITAAARGITNTLDGFIVQNETISESPVIEQTPDQNGAIAAEEVYDHRYDLSLTLISSSNKRDKPTVGHDGKITYAGRTWMVDRIEAAGTYNGLLRFNITAHGYINTEGHE